MFALSNLLNIVTKSVATQFPFQSVDVVNRLDILIVLLLTVLWVYIRRSVPVSLDIDAIDQVEKIINELKDLHRLKAD